MFIGDRRLPTRVMLNNPLNVSMIVDQTRADSVVLRFIGEREKGSSAERSDHETILLKNTRSSQSVQRFVA